MFVQKRRWMIGSAYVAALLAGWTGVKMGRGVNAGPSQATAGRDSSGRVGLAPPEIEEIFAKLQAQEKLKPSFGNRQPKLYKDYLAKVAELRGTLVPADDVAKAARDAMATCPEFDPGLSDELEVNMTARAVVAVRFLQWMAADPDAAFAFINGLKSGVSRGPQTAILLWAAEMPRGEVLARWSAGKPDSMMARTIVEGMTKQITESGDMAAYAELRSRLPASAFDENVLKRMMKEWPQERLPDFVPKALEWKSPKLMAMALEGMSAADTCENFKSLLSTEEGRALLGKGGATYALQDKICADGSLPLQERIDLLEQLYVLRGDELGPGLSKIAVRNYESNNFVRDGGEDVLMNDFQSGAIDAREAQQKLLAAMPETAGLSETVARDQAYGQLSNRDPVKALTLLDDLPPDQRYRQAMKYATWDFTNPSPERLYQLYEAVPVDPAFDRAGERQNAWNSMTTIAYNRYGEQYPEWVEGLPPGMNRDLALTALARRLEEEDPGKASELRAKISNPSASK